MQTSSAQGFPRRELERRTRPGAPPSSASAEAVGAAARLSPAEERRLIAAAQGGDYRARAQVVEAFLPLIGGVARIYRPSRRVTRGELVQEGVVGLLRALERFDVGHEVPFWAYASWWVRQAMQQLVTELNRPVVLSDRALRQLAQVKEADDELRRQSGRAPALTELAEQAGLDVEQLATLVAADRPPRALEEPLEGEEGTLGSFGELIADPLAEDEYERVVSSLTAGALRDLLSDLSDRERAVVRAHYGFDGEPESLRQIAQRLGVSAERVRQLENRALGKLRAAALGSSGEDGG